MVMSYRWLLLVLLLEVNYSLSWYLLVACWIEPLRVYKGHTQYSYDRKRTIIQLWLSHYYIQSKNDSFLCTVEQTKVLFLFFHKYPFNGFIIFSNQPWYTLIENNATSSMNNLASGWVIWEQKSCRMLLLNKFLQFI